VSTDLMIPDYTTEIERAADPAAYVIAACERAKTWLAHALEHGGIDQIVEMKSQAEAIRVYTMSKQLGQDAQLSAAEIVRRAERGIGLAIRKGQAEGTMARPGMVPPSTQKPFERVRRGVREIVSPPRRPHVRDANLRSPREFLASGSESAQTYAVTDGVSDEEFEAAIGQARREGNMSRANVIRRVTQRRHQESPADVEPGSEAPDTPDPGDRATGAGFRRREIVREMATAGYTSQQIGNRLGRSDEWVRLTARQMSVEIQADVAMGRGTRKSIDSNRIVSETAIALEGLVMAVNQVRLDDLDPAQMHHWATSITASTRTLNRLARQIKERTTQ